MSPKTRFHQRLGVQLGVTVAIVTGLAFAFTVTTVVRRARETLTRELTLRLLAKSRSLSLGAAAPLLRHDPELGLHALIRSALAETPDLVDLVILDANGRVQGHRDLLRVGTRLPPPPERRALAIPGLAGESVWLEGPHLVIESPIRHVDRNVGTLVLRASRDEIESTVWQAQAYLVSVGGLATLLTLLAVTGVVHLNLRPLGPLRRGVQRLGAGDLGTRVRVRSRNELGLFANLINSMAENLEKAQTDLVQKERLDRELEIARQLQSMLLPRVVQPAPGYELEAHYTPALEVSGDYYDVFALDEQHLALATADVSGKGIPGLVVMAMLRTTLRGLATPGRDPVDVLLAASRMLHHSMGRGMFVTCLYGVLDTRLHSFTYASAGQCPPAVFGRGGARYLPARGKPMGIFDEARFQESLQRHELSFAPGDGLLLYTDGLLETMNARGEQLGSPAVLQLLEGCSSTHAVVERLRRRVEAHRGAEPLSDDLTLLALQRLATAPPAAARAAGAVSAPREAPA